MMNSKKLDLPTKPEAEKKATRDDTDDESHIEDQFEFYKSDVAHQDGGSGSSNFTEVKRQQLKAKGQTLHTGELQVDCAIEASPPTAGIPPQHPASPELRSRGVMLPLISW